MKNANISFSKCQQFRLCLESFGLSPLSALTRPRISSSTVFQPSYELSHSQSHFHLSLSHTDKYKLVSNEALTFQEKLSPCTIKDRHCVKWQDRSSLSSLVRGIAESAVCFLPERCLPGLEVGVIIKISIYGHTVQAFMGCAVVANSNHKTHKSLLEAQVF